MRECSFCCWTLTFCLQGRSKKKKCSPQLLWQWCPLAYSRAIQPVGTSRGQGKRAPDVWVPLSDDSTVAWRDMTYPWGRTIVWYSVLLHWWLYMWAFTCETSHTLKPDNNWWIASARLNGTAGVWMNLNGVVSRQKLLRHHNVLWGESLSYFWAYCTLWTAEGRMPLEKEIAF